MNYRWRISVALLAIFVMGCQADAAPPTLENSLALAKANGTPVLIVGTAHG